MVFDNIRSHYNQCLDCCLIHSCREIISKPIKKIRNTAKEISNRNLVDAKSKETGNYELPSNCNNKEKNRHNDEINDLAFQFDKMRKIWNTQTQICRRQ